MLCREGDLSPTVRDLVEHARELGVPILGESEREMRRMSSGESVPELIALEGSGGNATLDELMSSDGLVCVLIGLRYPGNVGFIIRSAEVAGLAGIVVTTDWEGSQLSEALRVGMRADRFFPVIESDADAAIAAARRAGRRVVALETTGTKAPWQTDLSLPTALVVGSETTGISESLLASMDDVVRLPTHGFIPSYNVQAAVGMLLGEWLRQNQS
jgi:TrmH family RNA methyltransferase